MPGRRGGGSGGAAVTVPVIGRTFRTGWYYTGDTGANDTTQALSHDNLYAIPFTCGETATFDRIGLEVTTLAASSTIRLGIYNDSHGAPSTLVLDAGTIDSSTTGAKEITISQQLTAGRYWLAAQPITGDPQVRARSNTPLGRVGWASIANVNEQFVAVAHTGALAGSFGTPTANQGNMPKIMLRAA